MKKFLSLVLLSSVVLSSGLQAGLGDIVGAGLLGAGAVANEVAEDVGDVVGGPYYYDGYEDYDDDDVDDSVYYTGRYHGRRYYGDGYGFRRRRLDRYDDGRGSRRAFRRGY